MLQQGPSALPESRVLLRDYAKRFAGRGAQGRARTALYMVWPSKARSRDFDDVSESYALAARDVDGMLLPAGDAWREVWRRDPSLALYADDGFHPSALGFLRGSAHDLERAFGAVSARPARPASISPPRSGCCRKQPTRATAVSASPSKESAGPR